MFDMKYLKYQLSDWASKIFTPDYFVIKKIIRGLIHQEGKKTILEIGCGTGTLASLFSPHEYLGLDIDARAVSYAKQQYPEFKFLVCDGIVLGLKGKFDFVFVIGVFHHLDDGDSLKLLNTIKAVLSDKGRIVIIEAIPPLFKGLRNYQYTYSG